MVVVAWLWTVLLSQESDAMPCSESRPLADDSSNRDYILEFRP